MSNLPPNSQQSSHGNNSQSFPYKQYSQLPRPDQRQYSDTNPPQNQKSSPRNFLVVFLLNIFLGIFGIDRFYTGKIISGIIKLVTGGVAGLWVFIDGIILLLGHPTDAQGRPLTENTSQNRMIGWILLIVLYLPIFLGVAFSIILPFIIGIAAVISLAFKNEMFFYQTITYFIC